MMTADPACFSWHSWSTPSTLSYGDDNADKVRRFGQVADTPVRFDAVDLVVIRVYGIHPDAIFSPQHRVQQTPAIAAFRRCADHRNGTWIEHLMDRPHLVVRPTSS
jgi:hypothetical protein